MSYPSGGAGYPGGGYSHQQAVPGYPQPQFQPPPYTNNQPGGFAYPQQQPPPPGQFINYPPPGGPSGYGPGPGPAGYDFVPGQQGMVVQQQPGGGDQGRSSRAEECAKMFCCCLAGYCICDCIFDMLSCWCDLCVDDCFD